MSTQSNPPSTTPAEAQSRVAVRSGALLAINDPHQKQNNPQVSVPHPCCEGHQNDKPSFPMCGDGRIPLPQLLALFERPELASDWIPELVRNTQDRDHLKALGDLWRSLGRPASGFWLHTYVFCIDIWNSYDVLAKVMANDQAHLQPPGDEVGREKDS